jgi:hypothetical protein
MQSSQNFVIKNFINRSILLGVIGAAVALVYAFYLPKEYLVVGKLVVFPSSSAVQKNLGEEVGNTVEILSNSAFQLNTFQGTMRNFAFAQKMDNSSTVKVAFYAQKNEEVAAEDAIVRIPAALVEYTRDLYDGNPFKYKLMSDPEISVNPARPNLAAYLSGGFVIGFLLSILYWFLFEFLRLPVEMESEKSKKIVSPVFESAAAEKETIEKEKVTSQPARMIEPISRSAVPENLPITGGEVESTSSSEEPSDEEVKERLNKLMRGEL